MVEPFRSDPNREWPIFIPIRRKWGGYTSPVDLERIAYVLELEEPDKLAKHQMIDLWNEFTDVYLPRYGDRGKRLKVMPGGIDDQAAAPTVDERFSKLQKLISQVPDPLG